MLSATREDYIRAIYLLSFDSSASVTDVADRLSLSKSTVSERIQDLVTDGLVETEPYSGVSLTAKGLEVAKVLTYKHRIIEVFLHETLGIDAEKVHIEAEKLEHAFSDEVIKKLAKFLKNPTSDPHGTKITKPKRW